MKKIILLLIIAAITLSCSKEKEEENYVNLELLGKWQLIEAYEDEGDGNGEYVSIESEKIIEFFDDGTFVLNGPLCQLSDVIGENVIGKVIVSDLSSQDILSTTEMCDSNAYAEYGVYIQNFNLIVYLTSCVEGCGLKYQKLDE